MRGCGALVRRCAQRTFFGGLEEAARRAGEAAGAKNVFVLGADIARQLLGAGLLDEPRIHLVPLLLGGGTRLFDGERAELIPKGKPIVGPVTHLHIRVVRPPEPFADRESQERRLEQWEAMK